MAMFRCILVTTTWGVSLLAFGGTRVGGRGDAIKHSTMFRMGPTAKSDLAPKAQAEKLTLGTLG